MSAPILFATIEILRAFISWEVPMGMIRYETVCTQTIEWQIPDLRQEGPQARPDWNQVSCPSVYESTPVDVQLSARAFLTRDQEGERLVATYILDVIPQPPASFIKEIQFPSGWDFATENLSLRSWITTVRPTEFLQITCEGSQCYADGPQSTWRAKIKVSASPPTVSNKHQ